MPRLRLAHQVAEWRRLVSLIEALNMFAVFLLNRWRRMGHVALVEIFMGQDRHVASEARLSPERASAARQQKSG